MKHFMKYVAICMVIATISGVYWIWSHPLTVEPEAPVNPLMEPVKEQDFSWITIDENTPPEDEVPMLREPSVTVTEQEDGTVVIDREWGSKPADADTKPAPDVPDANIASGGGDMELDEDGMYHGDVEPEPKQPKPELPVEPEPIPEPVEPEPVKPETPKEPDVDPITGKPNYEGEDGTIFFDGDWLWAG